MLKLKNIKKSIFIIVFLSLILLTSDLAFAEDNNLTAIGEIGINDDINVDSQDIESISTKGTANDINQQIKNAASGGTITLDKDYYSIGGSSITIGKPLTIIGNGNTVIDGNNQFSVLSIESSGVTIKNIEFTGFLGKSNGGPIISNGNGVTIDNCVFHHNAVSDSGGAIYINGDSTTVSNCQFYNNFAIGGGGAIYVDGKHTTISNCEFYNNEARAGGAIYSNYVSAGKGAGEYLKILNCNFHNNLAHVGGGAVGMYGNHTEIRNCVFTSNKVYDKNDEGVGGYGGALQIGMDGYYMVSQCVDCLFTNNSAISKTDSLISHGGAACIRDGIVFDNCTFISNTADQGGAMTYHSGGIVKNCIFIRNTALKLYGGAISTGYNVSNMDLKIEKSTFDSNTAPIGGAVHLIGENVVLDNCGFKYNLAYKNGGAIYIESQTTTVQNSHIGQNMALTNGGAIYINSKTTKILDNYLFENIALPSPQLLNDGLGGAIFIDSTESLISNNRFEFNEARNGSAIYISKKSNEAIISNNEFKSNQAWIYQLEIYGPKNPLLHGESVYISSIIHGGNNIGNSSNIYISNAIYNAASNSKIIIDGIQPLNGATNTGKLYQDDREYNIDIYIEIMDENENVVYQDILKSNVYGNVNLTLPNLDAGRYTANAYHYEDTYYKAISNQTSFVILPVVDNLISKDSQQDSYNYKDIVAWNLTVTNNGPDKATEVVVNDKLPDSLIYLSDNGNGSYDVNAGIWNVGELDVGETKVLTILTLVNTTKNVINHANITSKEHDYNLTNNYDDELIELNPSADLAIIKAVNNTNPNYGDFVKWTIEVSNNGPDVGNEIKITDILPEGLIFISSNGNYNNGVWTIEKLEVGESKTLEIVCKVNKTGLITNNVNVTGKEYDFNLVNNNDTVSINVDKSADLEVVKTVNNTNPNYLDLVQWTIKVINHGPDAASEINVNELLPQGLVIIDWKGEGEFKNNLWNIGELEVGEEKTLNLICLVNKTGELINIVTVNGKEYDFNKFNNKDNETIVVNPASDLAVIKTVNNSNPNYGDIITWIIEVSNNGPDIASDVIVKDILPEGLIFVRGSENYNNGTWNINKLLVGETKVFEIICKINKTGEFTNIVTVNGNEYDYNKTNNLDNETIYVNSSADLVVIKTVNNTNPNYRDTINWTVKVKNNGPNIATNVLVKELMPECLIIVDWEGEGEFKNNVWNVGDLKVGEEKTLNLICLVNKTGQFTNIVMVNGSEYDSNKTNNIDNETIIVNSSADLAVLKTVNNSNPNYGDVVKWTIKVTNNGPDIATNVSVKELLPEGLIYLRNSVSKGFFDSNSGIWTINSLSPNNFEYLDIYCRVNKSGEFTNVVSVTGNEYDYNKTNNVDDESITVEKTADLEIIKLVNNSNPDYREQITWTLIIKNNGPDDATGVIVVDSIPDGLIGISDNIGGNYNDGIWYVGNLGCGETKEWKIVCIVNKTGDIVNVASINGNEADLNLENNNASAIIHVRPAVDLSITKTSSKVEYVVGDIIDYTVNVTNNGPDTATNVIVSDYLDNGLSFRSFKSDNGYFNEDGSEWRIDSLASGESEILTFQAKATKSGSVMNKVLAICDEFDYDLSNNNASAEVKINDIISNSINTIAPILYGEQLTVLNDVSKKAIVHGLENIEKTGNPIAIILLSLIMLVPIYLRKM